MAVLLANCCVAGWSLPMMTRLASGLSPQSRASPQALRLVQHHATLVGVLPCLLFRDCVGGGRLRPSLRTKVLTGVKVPNGLHIRSRILTPRPLCRERALWRLLRLLKWTTAMAAGMTDHGWTVQEHCPGTCHRHAGPPGGAGILHGCCTVCLSAGACDPGQVQSSRVQGHSVFV